MDEKTARYLLDLLKESYNKIELPNHFNKAESKVHSISTNDEFIINMYRGASNINKYTIQIRTKGTNYILMRLDVDDNAFHKNSDGTTIRGTHIHLYKNGVDTLDAIKYKATNVFIDDCITFMKKVKIINFNGVYQGSLPIIN